MSEQELRNIRKLSRVELFELLVEQGKENEELHRQVENLQEQLEERQISLTQAGNIAEASLKLNGIFQAAQDAAQQYLDSIRQLSEHQEEICREMEEKTRKKCDALYQETKEKCYQMEIDARDGVDQYWKELSRRLKSFRREQEEAANVSPNV